MKFSIPREVLASATNRVGRVASGGAEGADGVRITASSGSVKFEATDGSVTVVTEVAAETAEDGIVVVPAKLLDATVAQLTGADVTLFTSGSVLNVTDDAGQTAVPTTAENRFPEVPQPASATTTTFAGGELVAAVAAVERAASVDRPALSGIFFDSDGGSLRLVATNSYCLACVDTGLPALETTPYVPAAGLRTAMKILDTASDIVVASEGSRIRLDDGVTSVTLALLNDPFPSTYRNLLEVKVAATVTVSAAALTAAVNRAKVVLTVDKPIRIEGSADKGVTVSAVSADSGSAAVDVADATVEGAELTVDLNHVYTLNAIKSLGADIVVSWQEPNRAVVFNSDGTRWLVMPTRSS